MMRTLFALLLLSCLSSAHAALDPAALQALAGDDLDARNAAVVALALSADPQARVVLLALRDDALYTADGRVLVIDGEHLSDAASGASVAPAPDSPEPLTVNNLLRGQVGKALALGDLHSAEVRVRRAAAHELADAPPPAFAAIMHAVALAETDAETAALLRNAAAQAKLSSNDAAQRLAAVQELASSGDPAVAPLLRPFAEASDADPALRSAARAALAAINDRLYWGELLDRVFTGVSLGSILLLGALGLAITYGVMGVINMAHGEFLMIGAYSAYVTQGLFQRHWPAAQAWYLAAALPVSFLAAALVGVLLERLVIRHLYGRPLETLLASWGLSLILIQAARVLFGPQNVQVDNPGWMSGSLVLTPSLVLPWNRMLIIAFAIAVLVLTWALMQRTRLGLYVRAVTQNRPMAACVGVHTQRIDSLAFGLGAGIAGLGGVALSQISNVGPQMGQGYIVDAFMVVVLGGVGQLAGAVWAALGLGVAAKFLEGWTGAVIAKILVLVFVIVFIQKRPQGLFAQRGRHVEA
ncbi:MAG: urea ABC transporter permease subunit UrtB [Pseudomonadota bacterium]|nr:urea ABC transporter permease subunit UrtB [Pseudomonadota bacterium]